jgi:hypothetical protein
VAFRDSPEDVVAAVAKLEDPEKTTVLLDFLDRVRLYSFLLFS